MSITVEGFVGASKSNPRRVTGARVYETSDISHREDGTRHVPPTSWRLNRELKFNVLNGRLCAPDIELTPTVGEDAPGTKLYAYIFVDEQGKELWRGDEDDWLELPACLPSRIAWASWLLVNLEIRGEIAPGQDIW